MKKIKLTNIVTFLVLAMITSSCYEDFLNPKPVTDVLTLDVFSDLNFIETNLLPGAYQPLRWEFNPEYGDSYCMTYLYTDVRSDDAVVENHYFQPHSHGFETFVDLDQANINVQGIWAKLFKGVTASNEIVQGLLLLDDDSEQKKTILAEARFLRAYYYFQLVKNFGDVPLFGDEWIDLTISENAKRKPVAEVYAQIESDLTAAAQVLPDMQADAYRASKGAALGILTRVYIFQEKWNEAAQAAQDIIDLGLYELEEIYEDNFKITNEFGKESIFEVSYINDVSGGSWNPNSLTSLSLQFFAPNFHPTPITGWSYNLPTANLLAAFNGEGDTERRDATIMQEGHEFDSDAMVSEGFSPIPDGWFDTWLNSEESGGQRYGDDLNYSMKYLLTPEEVTEHCPGINQSTLNHKVLRYADVLLMLAEATLHGAPGDGQAAFDAVRTRAGLDPKPLTLESLKLERRLELATEYIRFHDLVRWGDAATVLDGFSTGRDELLPVPINDILLTGKDSEGKFILEQNPGYYE